jgi:hypothetical protein
MSTNKSVTKRVTYMVSLIVIITIIFASAYFLIFFREGISHNPNDWASFGSYLGGVVGPVIALGSLFGLALLIDLQKKTIEVTREEMATSNQHLANQHFSTAVFELMRTVTLLKQGIRWHPTNLFNSANEEEYKIGEIAINAIFQKTLQILEQSPEWSSKHCEALLNSTYADFKLAHQGFGTYWNFLKESMDEIEFRGQQVSKETMHHGVRLFLTALSGREYIVFYLIHCLSKEWRRLDLLDNSKMLDRIEDYHVDRLRMCRSYAVGDSKPYSVTPSDISEIEQTGRGMHRFKRSSSDESAGS